jgi:hypothetical protein
MTEFAIRDCAALAEIKHITAQSSDSTTLWTRAWQVGVAAWMVRHRSMLDAPSRLTVMYLAANPCRTAHSAPSSACVAGALAPRATDARSGRSGCA